MSFQKFVTTTQGIDVSLGDTPLDRRPQGIQEETQLFRIILNHTSKRRVLSRRDTTLHSHPLKSINSFRIFICYCNPGILYLTSCNNQVLLFIY
ncbi:hypothetical protein Hanom_Chr04g00281941 [Helianthus anomalus]